MLKVTTNLDISHRNTLHLPCIASKFLSISHEQDLQDAFDQFPLNSSNILILGGGSNLILPPKVERYVLSFETCSASSGSKLTASTEDKVCIEVQAGVVWDDFVAYCVENAYHGLENLSLIPGTVGAAPIQNIGAYGVEVADLIKRVKVFQVEQQKTLYLEPFQCQFAYRDSVFKRQPNDYIILSVEFELSIKPMFTLSYGELKLLSDTSELNVQLVRDKVIATRQAKLPDPNVLPNAGSFFKNPVVSYDQLANLLIDYPELVHYPLPSGESKLAAGWLIQKAGLKGYRNESVGVHAQQALVLINHHHGSQQDILSLAEKVQQTVFEHFQVMLEREPVLIEA